MEGYTLSRRLRELLAETSGGTFMNDRTTYDCLYDAAKDFNKRTHYLTGTQSITIIAGTAAYNLNPDHVCLALMDRFNRPYIKWTVSGSDTFIHPMDYQDVIIANDTSSTSIPSGFSIVDASQESRITGTATSSGAASAGECTLTDTNADFTNVSAGDFVHNTTDGSHGIVISKTSTTALLCALFEGSGNDWTQNDAYVIVPQARYQIIFTPTPSASATATINYVQRPNPVYSSYGAYKFPSDAELPLCQFAAFVYKYRDREPNYGDALFGHYDRFTRKAAMEYKRGIPNKTSFSMNMAKGASRRSTGTGGWR